MGNQQKKQNLKGNRIVVEFLTPKQKILKDRRIYKFQTEVEQLQKEEEFEVIGGECLDYSYKFRKVIHTEEEQVELNMLYALIVNRTETQKEWLKIQQFFEANVKSCQIFFNNFEIGRAEQYYNFTKRNLEPLNIEIIYKQKHWLERLFANLKQTGSRVVSALSVIGNVATVVSPVWNIFNLANPFIIPTLKSMKIGTSMVMPQSSMVNSIEILICGLTKISQVSAPIVDKVTQLVPKSLNPQSLSIILVMYLGRGALLSTIKFIILIFFPFLSPLFWLVGL